MNSTLGFSVGNVFYDWFILKLQMMRDIPPSLLAMNPIPSFHSASTSAFSVGNVFSLENVVQNVEQADAAHGE